MSSTDFAKFLCISCILGDGGCELKSCLNLDKGKVEGANFLKSVKSYLLYCVHQVRGFFMNVQVVNHVRKHGLNMQQHRNKISMISISVPKIAKVVSDFAGSEISLMICCNNVLLTVFLNTNGGIVGAGVGMGMLKV